MKNKILLFAFCFAIISLNLSAQFGYLSVKSYGNGYSRLKTDSAQHVPTKVTLALNDQDTTPQIFVKNDTLFYFSNGTYKSLGVTAVFQASTVVTPTCPASAVTSLGTTTTTTQVVNWNVTGSNTYNMVVTPTFGGSAITFNGVSPPFTVTGLTAGTGYTVTLTTVCTSGGTPNSSTNNFTTNTAPSIQFQFAYTANDPYVDNNTAPTLSSPTAYTISHNANLVFTVPPASADNFLILQVPSGESLKTSWYYNSLNSGKIPDAFTRAPFTVGGYTYYITRVTLARDPSTTTMSFTNP